MLTQRQHLREVPGASIVSQIRKEPKWPISGPLSRLGVVGEITVHRSGVKMCDIILKPSMGPPAPHPPPLSNHMLPV